MYSYVQQFQFIIKSGRMVIADPCVFEDTFGAVSLRNVRSGIWTAHFSYNYAGNLEHAIAKHEKPSILSHREKIHEIEVQSEQIGFFDRKFYRNDQLAKELPVEPYVIVKKGDLWYCAMSYITNHGPNGAGAFGYGAITDTQSKSHLVIAKKSWVGDYVEFEIRLK